MTEDNTTPPDRKIDLKKREASEVLEEAIEHLWGVVNGLSNLKEQECSKYYRVTIFGSARIKRDDPIYANIRDLAAQLSSMGCDIVTGGGPGLMQAANEGENIGDPEHKTRSYGIRVDLPFEAGANPYVEKSFTHGTFYTRLHHFVNLSNAFIIVPGGIGTTLEAMMVWQLLQVNHINNKPLIFVGAMWKELVTWTRDNMLTHTPPLASPKDIDLPQCVDTIDEAVAIIKPHQEQWKTHSN